MDVNYISAEKFLEQPKKVQRALKEWWKPKNFDIYHHTKLNIDTVVIEHPTVKFNKEDTIPLFKEEQLRKIIESKGYKFIGINNFIEIENKEAWNIKVFKSMMQFEPEMEFYCDTPLECFWSVACEIVAS